MELENTSALLDNNAWISREVLEWHRLLKGRDSNAITSFLISASDHIASLNDANDRDKCLELFELFGEQLTMTHASFKTILYSCGVYAYNHGNYAVAEKAFKILADYNDSNGRNKYADMLRQNVFVNHSPCNFAVFFVIFRQICAADQRGRFFSNERISVFPVNTGIFCPFQSALFC